MREKWSFFSTATIWVGVGLTVVNYNDGVCFFRDGLWTLTITPTESLQRYWISTKSTRWSTSSTPVTTLEGSTSRTTSARWLIIAGLVRIRTRNPVVPSWLISLRRPCAATRRFFHFYLCFAWRTLPSWSPFWLHLGEAKSRGMWWGRMAALLHRLLTGCRELGTWANIKPWLLLFVWKTNPYSAGPCTIPGKFLLGR